MNRLKTNTLKNFQKYVLVVGTTVDYIDWIRESCPGQCLFIVNMPGKSGQNEAVQRREDLIFSNLLDFEDTFLSIDAFLTEKMAQIEGIACFDCEFMELTSRLANVLHLPYPSLPSVLACRSKYNSKALWKDSRVSCPRAELIFSADKAGQFMEKTGGPCVLKPVSGSGSELVFLCKDVSSCQSAYETISKGISDRHKNPLYNSEYSKGVVIEEYIEGEEYSCDFMVTNGSVNILRLSKKIYYPGGPFGTVWGYIFSTFNPIKSFHKKLEKLLQAATDSLCINRAVCMADFIVNKKKIFLIEITPRPGGDCIPHLLKKVWNMDMLALNINFARIKEPLFPILNNSTHTYLGFRIFAKQEGVLKSVGFDTLKDDKRVVDVYLKYHPGHIIKMPPEDYDSRILGHVIVRLDTTENVAQPCREIENLIKVVVE